VQMEMDMDCVGRTGFVPEVAVADGRGQYQPVRLSSGSGLPNPGISLLDAVHEEGLVAHSGNGHLAG